MADFDNLFDAAIVRADETIRGYMGTSATMTSGEQSGAVIRGVFDDPENISYAGQGVRVEGSSPSLFVRTDDVRQLRRGDTLTIGEEKLSCSCASYQRLGLGLGLGWGKRPLFCRCFWASFSSFFF